MANTNNEEIAIVDFKPLYLDKNELIVKELAIFRVNDGTIVCPLFNPPLEWSALSDFAKEQNLILTRSYHGLKWKSKGGLPYNQVDYYLKNYLKDVPTIFVQGIPHQKFIQKFVDPDKSKVYNVSNHGFPGFDKIPMGDLGCHNNHGIKNFHCANRDVIRIFKWLTNSPEVHNIQCEVEHTKF